MTVVMSLFLIFTGTEFGPMKLNEDNAKNGDLFTTDVYKRQGHASITTTMNRYVHVTDDSMKKAVAQFAKAQEAQKG